jgi:hypothetical protein
MAGKVLTKFLPPPTKGVNYNLLPTQSDPMYATAIENMICRPSGIVIPGGRFQVASGGAKTGHFSLHSHDGGTTQLFVSTTTGIFPAGGGVPTIALTNSRGWFNRVSTAAGQYSCFFNAVDTPKIFDGTSWAAMTLTGTGLTTTNLFQGIVYRQRMYMADKTKLGFWYLAPGSISGSAQFYDAGTIFRKGGLLTALGVYSADSGSGSDDCLIAYSSLGEVAVFSGNDPGASTWTPVGCFYVGPGPSVGSSITSLGTWNPDLIANLGGDALILTQSGIFQLSEVRKQAGLFGAKSISYAINPIILANATSSGRAWGIWTLPSTKLLFLSIDGIVYVMDFDTGGWSYLISDSTPSGTTPRWGSCRAFSEVRVSTTNVPVMLSGINSTTTWSSIAEYEVISAFATSIATTTSLLQGSIKLQYPNIRMDVGDTKFLDYTPYILASQRYALTFNSLSMFQFSTPDSIQAILADANNWLPLDGSTAFATFKSYTPAIVPGRTFSWGFSISTAQSAGHTSYGTFLGVDLRAETVMPST